MERISNSSSSSSSRQRSQVQLHNSKFKEQLKETQTLIITPKKRHKRQTQNIFEETPKPVFIPISNKHHEYEDIKVSSSLKAQDMPQPSPLQPHRKKNKSIFEQNSVNQKRQAKDNLNGPKGNRQNIDKNIKQKQKVVHSSNTSTSSIIKSKTSIQFKKQRISQFFHYQNFIVCKGLRKVIVYNFFNKSLIHIPVNFDQFVLTQYPPYVFNCCIGQYLNLYSEIAVQKFGQIERKRNHAIKLKMAAIQEQIKHKKHEKPEQKLQNQQNFTLENQEKLIAEIQVVVMKISKLQVQVICKYGQTYFMGGYNRSVLPGGKKSERRQIHILQNLDPKINNKPKDIIKIQSNQFPISIIQVQTPFLVVYCRPYFYMFGLKSHDLLLTFQKQLKSCLLLQGRYALNALNGVGITITKGMKHHIFTYDVQSLPIFGVEITQHKQQATSLCLEKTGRIFGGFKNSLFQYIPTKRITRCVKIYPQNETILWIQSTANNNMLVLRQTQNLQYVIEAFSIEESSVIGQY